MSAVLSPIILNILQSNSKTMTSKQIWEELPCGDTAYSQRSVVMALGHLHANGHVVAHYKGRGKAALYEMTRS